jgi:hypothetical protein
MPAIAYTSGAPWWEPPTIGGRAWEPFGHPGSVFSSQGSIDRCLIDVHSIARDRCERQPLPASLSTVTQCHGAHLVTGTKRERARKYHAGGPRVKL